MMVNITSKRYVPHVTHPNKHISTLNQLANPFQNIISFCSLQLLYFYVNPVEYNEYLASTVDIDGVLL